MVTALLRDQDKVLLLAHTFPVERVQASLAIPLLPASRLLWGFQLGYMGWLGSLGQSFLSWIL